MHRLRLFASLAAAVMLSTAAPAIAAVAPVTPDLGIAQGYGCEVPQTKPGAYAIDMLFAESTDLELCEPQLLAATGLCLEPVRFDGRSGPGLVLDIRRLDCALSQRSPPS